MFWDSKGFCWGGNQERESMIRTGRVVVMSDIVSEEMLR